MGWMPEPCSIVGTHSSTGVVHTSGASMASQTMLRSTAFTGTALPKQQRLPRSQHRVALAPQALAGKRKVNSYDEEWKKGFFGSGYFVEASESGPVNYLKKVEQKKILSGVEKLGLLSKAEKAGITLSKIEKLGLLSLAERLGLLALAEELLVTDPGKVTSFSILPFIVTIGALVVIPEDNVVETVLKYSFSAVSFGVFVTFFIGGFILNSLQEE